MRSQLVMRCGFLIETVEWSKANLKFFYGWIGFLGDRCYLVPEIHYKELKRGNLRRREREELVNKADWRPKRG